MYRWLIFLHVLGVFGFLLAHGASAIMTLQLRKEHDLMRIRALLDLSSNSRGLMNGSLMLVLVTGIIGGFMGNWWGQGWIWAALGLLIALSAAMFFLGTRYYHRVRKAAGLSYSDGRREHPAEAPSSEAEIAALIAAGNPVTLMAIGVGGLVVILWLMMFKPF